MERILKLALVLVLLYLGWTRGLPWLEQRFGGGGGGGGAAGDGEGGRCAAAAEGANDAFAAEIRRFPAPPVDPDAWGEAMATIEGRLDGARSACRCPLDSCARAAEALDEIADLVARFDDGVRGGGVPLNPARDQVRIERLLGEAKSLARRGQ